MEPSPVPFSMTQIQLRDMKTLTLEFTTYSNSMLKIFKIDIDKFLPNKMSSRETQFITVP